MGKGAIPTRAPDSATALAAAAALLLASLGNFLSYNRYPLVRPEMGLLVLGLLAVAGAVGVFHARLPRAGRCVVEGLLAAWFVDLNTDSIPLMAAAGIGVAAFGWWRRMSLAGPMAVLGSVVLATTLLGLGRSPDWIKVEQGSRTNTAAAAERPPILHILLDEQLGIEGMRSEGAGGERLAGELRASYLKSGFALYGGAYSRYFDTVNAVPDVLNFGTRLGENVRKGGVEVRPAEYFKALAGRGYRLTIFQSDYADYCSGTPFGECITYDSSSLRPTLDVPMTASERTQLIALKFLALSDLFRLSAKGWNLLAKASGGRIPRHDFDAKNSSTVGSLAALPELARRLAQASPGDAYFAHLLLPHYPYAVGRDCRYTRWSTRLGRHSDAPVAVRRPAYYDQVRCTNAKLAALVRAFSRAAGPDSIVIIHGDHGSRITAVDPYQANLGKIGDGDVIAGFSTLFAIRAPGVTPAYVPERAPLPNLLRDFTRSGFGTAPQPRPQEPATVQIVARRSKKPVATLPLPASWPSPQGSEVGQKAFSH